MKRRLLLPSLVIALAGTVNAQSDQDPLLNGGYSATEQKLIEGLIPNWEYPGRELKIKMVAGIIRTAPPELREHLGLDIPSLRKDHSFIQSLATIKEVKFGEANYHVCVFEPTHLITPGDNFHEIVLLNPENQVAAWLRANGKTQFQVATIFQPRSQPDQAMEPPLERIYLIITYTKGIWSEGILNFQMFRLKPNEITLAGEGRNSEELQKSARAEKEAVERLRPNPPAN